MRVGLVAEGFSKSAGVGTERYSWELAAGLRALGFEVQRIESRPRRIRFALAANALTAIPFKTIQARSRTDLFHATDPSSALTLPMTGARTVVTFHDLMPLLLRGAHYNLGDRIFSTASYHASSKCGAIVSVSQQTKDEVVEVIGVEKSKIRVIPLGVSEAFRRDRAVKKESALVGYVGDITPRKRLDLLIRAFVEVKRQIPQARLVIVGSNVAEFLSHEMQKAVQLARTLSLSDVTFTGRISEDELIRMYNRMRVLILPSDYEGFGLPILEAMRCGTPVVIRSEARIPGEVAGAAIRASGVAGIAESVINLIEDEDDFRHAVDNGLRHSRSFTWEKCAERTARLYEELAS